MGRAARRRAVSRAGSSYAAGRRLSCLPGWAAAAPCCTDWPRSPVPYCSAVIPALVCAGRCPMPTKPSP